MMALALPMVIFYVVSIVIGIVVQRRKRAKQAAAS